VSEKARRVADAKGRRRWQIAYIDACKDILQTILLVNLLKSGKSLSLTKRRIVEKH